MKRISMILMAFVLVLTMTQCKKNEETNQDKTVTITLDVKGNLTSKVDVNTNTGTVNFETGDKVYVGSGGKYVGFLTHNGTSFVGNITNPTENQPLQFYFLGNVTPTETLSAGTTEECSVIISDQTEHLPVISCAASFENYVSGLTSYTGHLLNKCALVKFNVTTPSNSPICVTGMKNKVTVNFANNTMTPTIDGEGVIMLPAGSGENVEKWAILLPQEAVEEGNEGSVYSEDGSYSGIRPIVPAIVENGYLASGIAVMVNTQTVSGVPTGAINGLFTINANGDQVYFSQGNLQYIGSAAVPYWKFADYQWNYFGTSTGQNSSNQNVDRDLFGWGTSNYNHGASAYQPWCTSQNSSDYYAYGQSTYNLYDQTGQADWGHNAISNGGNEENCGWRSLTGDEWDYVFNTRTTNSSIRYVKGMVNSVKGIILLPDNWMSSIYTLNSPNGGNFNSNTISADDWINILETNGAVFLPVTGFRQGTTIKNLNDGDYWVSSRYLDDLANSLYFHSYGLVPKQNDAGRNLGFSVRLVRNAE